MPEQKVLLEEYNITQQTISHYESLIWTIGSIFNAIIVGTVGLAVKLDQPNSLILPIVVSIWFYALWFMFETRYQQINISKFRRLWEIEEQLGMKQNLFVREDDRKRRFKPRGHLLITFACAGFPIVLAAIYVVLTLTK